MQVPRNAINLRLSAEPIRNVPNPPILSWSTEARRALLVLCLLVLLAFWPGLGGSFLLDDFPIIVSNQSLHLTYLDWETLSTAAMSYDRSLPRPLAMAWFGLDFLIGGKNPWGFKLSNLLLHGANAAAVFAFVALLLQMASLPARSARRLALLLAGIWALHPLQVSTVLYVVQRMEMLSASFVLLALTTYLQGRRQQIEGNGSGWPLLWVSGLLAGLGMLSKETAILFPLFALALEVTVLKFCSRQQRDTRWLKAGYAVGLIFGCLAFLNWVVLPHMHPQAYASRDFSLAERLLSQPRVLTMHLAQILLPLSETMTFHYDQFVVSTGWLQPASTATSTLLLVGLFTVAIVMRHRRPLLALGVFWFFIAHFLTSNVFGLEMVFEHRNYLALLGVPLALLGLVHFATSATAPRSLIAAGLAVALVCGAITHSRAILWGEPLALSRYLVEINPASPRASSDLGTLYMAQANGNAESPFYQLGVEEFERAAKLPNASPLPEQGLILSAALFGRETHSAWWESLTAKLATRHIGVQEILAITGLMRQRFQGIALDDARLTAAYGTFLSRSPADPAYYRLFGDYALAVLDDSELAMRVYYEAIERSGYSTDYITNLATTLANNGYDAEARLVRQAATLSAGDN